MRLSLKERKRGIREVILLSFALLCIISLGTVAITSGIFVGVIGNITSTQTTDTLETQIQYDMLNKTQNYGLIINSQLEQTTKDINSLADAITNVFKNPFEFGYRRSYYHVDILTNGTIYLNDTVILTNITFPENIPPDVYENPILGLNASRNYSHYLVYKNAYNLMGNDTNNLTGIYGDYINRTAHLDPIMKQLIVNNPHYAWIYVDFEIGLQRTFPWSGVDKDIFGPDWKDYKADDWYIDAKAANGNIVWTAPYIDTYLGWIVTISRAVYNGSVSPANFLGVIGIDFKLDAITQTVGNIQLFKTGYGFLMDKDGWIITHPYVDFNPEEETATSIETAEPDLDAAIINSMKAGNSGFAEFTKGENGQEKTYYITYRTIPISNYVLGIVVPAEEVLAPVIALQNQITISLIIQLVIMFVILAMIIVLTLYIGVKISDSIVHPIKRLTDLALDLSTEDIKKTSLEKSEAIEQLDELIEKDDEIGGLSRSFKNLIMMVRDEAVSQGKSKEDSENKKD